MTDQMASAPRRPRTDRRSDWLRWALVAGWLAVVVALPLTGERVATWSDVKKLVASGEVTAVRVSAELAASDSGVAAVAVHWKHGLLSYVTAVDHVQGEVDAWSDKETTARLRSSPSGELLALQPGLTMSRDSSYEQGDRVLGFEVPVALSMFSLALLVLGFGVLVGGREPWRATRWAWFWLLWLPVVGALLFALLSGPFPGIRAPKNLERRLTGGWAFLFAAVASSVTISV